MTITNDTDQLHDVELRVLEPDGPSTVVGPTSSTSTSSIGGVSSHPSTHTGQASHIKLVFSGRTKGLVRVRPHTCETIRYRLCPLECGSLLLPRIQLKAAGLATTTLFSTTNSSGQSVTGSTLLLVDPNDTTGVVFVQPKSKHFNSPSLDSPLTIMPTVVSH